MRHRRWFFGLLVGLMVVIDVANQVTFEFESVVERLESALPLGVLAALVAVPLGTDRRWAHWIVVALVTGFVAWVAITNIIL